jgi:hypothetical protein
MKNISSALFAAARRTSALAPALAIDLAGIGGISSIAYGAWLIYPPAGYIVGGCIVVTIVILMARPAAETGK